MARYETRSGARTPRRPGPTWLLEGIATDLMAGLLAKRKMMGLPCMIAMTVEGPRMAAWGLDTVHTPEAFGPMLRAMRSRCWSMLLAQESAPAPERKWNTVVTDDVAEMTRLEAWAALAKATGRPLPLP
jgi:hypothetical protein